MAVKMKPQQQVQQPKAKLKPVLKTAPKLKAPVMGDVALTDAQQHTVNLLATVTQQIKEMDVSQLTKEKEGYRKALLDLCGDQPDGKEVRLETDDALVVFSAAPERKEIEDLNGLMGLLKEKVGYEGLLSLLKITLGDAQKYLSEAELQPFLKKAAGTRTLKTAVLKAS